MMFKIGFWCFFAAALFVILKLAGPLSGLSWWWLPAIFPLAPMALAVAAIAYGIVVLLIAVLVSR
jgi:hypothetical protein